MRTGGKECDKPWTGRTIAQKLEDGGWSGWQDLGNEGGVLEAYGYLNKLNAYGGPGRSEETAAVEDRWWFIW